MTLLGPARGDRMTALGSTYTTKAGAEVTGGAYWLVEEEFWGETTPLHRHSSAEEAFYVLSGRVAAWLEETEIEAGPGAFLLVPRGTPHALRRLGDDPVRMLTVVSPAGMEGFFAAVERIGEESLLAEPELLVSLAAEFGTEVLGEYPG